MRIIVTIFTSVCLLIASVSQAHPFAKTVMPAGTTIYVYENTSLPKIDVQVVIDAGAVRSETPGLAMLTARMMPTGTYGLSEDDIAQRFEEVGAVFYQHVGREQAVFHLTTLSDDHAKTQAFSTLSAVLTQPSFDDVALGREKHRMQVRIDEESRLPEKVAAKGFFQMLYGAHPYAADPLGNIESLEALTPESLLDFYQSFYIPANIVIAVAGDISTAEVEAWAQSMTEALPSGNQALPMPVVSVNTAPVSTHIPLDTQQVLVLKGMPAIVYGEPINYTLLVANEILGGGMRSRLFDKVRNEAGLAYSVYARMLPMRERGPFFMSVQTREHQAEQARDMLDKVYRTFIEEGPTAEELDMAKQKLIGRFPQLMSNLTNISETMADIGFYQLGDDYIDNYISNVENVTLGAVKQVLKTDFVDKPLVEVRVGPHA